MAKRYSKFHSNFILKKKHQETTKGTIWERDWVTIGAQHQIEKGKRIFYGDTNFLFTDNTFNSYKKRYKFSKWVAEWTYDEAIENSSPEVNVVTTNWESKDLRDFAYYGSCVELIKIAVLNIVKWFPGIMRRSTDSLYVGPKYGSFSNNFYTSGKRLNNPFGLILYRHRDEKTDTIENIKRYVYDSYDQYEINGEIINDYVVNIVPYDCIENITKICEISILSNYNKLYFIDGYYINGSITYVEGNSPYNLYYTFVFDDGGFNEIYPRANGIYRDRVYIHNDDLDKVYVLSHDVDVENVFETSYDLTETTTKSPVLFKWGDEMFYTKSFIGNIDFGEGVVSYTYYRDSNNDVTDIGDGVFYCWRVREDNSIPNVYTLTNDPKMGVDELYVKNNDENSMIRVEGSFSNYNVRPINNNRYTIFDYYNVDDIENEETEPISIEEYESLNDEEKEKYQPRYYWTVSVEDYLSIDKSQFWNANYYFIFNSSEVEPFFGEIGRVETLKEHPDNVTNYVNSLRGIEHLLLNNRTKPLYQATLLTPVETEKGYMYSEKFYTWPSSDGYIDVSSPMYQQYMDRLIETATLFDELWCDNLWRNMTHESIRNFDWSYKKDYVEGDEEAFVEGGKRMRDIIHIYGRVADELKRYIEGIKMTSVITYDNYNNMPSAEVSDKLEYRGWDVYSTIPMFNITDEVSVLDESMVQIGQESETVYTGEDLNDNETENIDNDNNEVLENSYDYSTVMLDERFMKSYVHKQYRRISHVDYYRLPAKSRSRYMFDYIRVTEDKPNNNNGCIEAKEYDAYGTDIISINEYNSLPQSLTNGYIVISDDDEKYYRNKDNGLDYSVDGNDYYAWTFNGITYYTKNTEQPQIDDRVYGDDGQETDLFITDVAFDNGYTIRYQDVIITKEEYDIAMEECEDIAEQYIPYQYINRFDKNDILSATDYDSIYWAEDYIEQKIQDTSGFVVATIYCKKKENSAAYSYIVIFGDNNQYYRNKDNGLDYSVDGNDYYAWTFNGITFYTKNTEYPQIDDRVYGVDGQETGLYITDVAGEFICDDSALSFKYEDYKLFRQGKDKYIPYTYRKVDDIVYASGIDSNIQGYEPYSIIVHTDTESIVYLASYFYPYEYQRISGDEFNISPDTNLAEESEDYEYNNVIIEDAKEIITFEQYNNIDEWQEDYFAFEYFKPSNVDSWIMESKQDGLTKFSWETVASLSDSERAMYRPYRYINLRDNDTIITPEQWKQLPSKTEWRIISYQCSLGDNIIISTEEYYENAYQYRRLNVISQSTYNSLSSVEKRHYAPYEPTEINNFDKWFNARNYAVETMGEQDIRFVKELMMLSNRMFATKGTRQGIDMIMSMFGFGSDTYTLTEKYHRIDLNKHIYDDMVVSKLQQAATIDEMAEDLYDEDNIIPRGTVPLDVTELHGVKYIIPYYYNGNKYAGDEVYFQSKGGWGYKFNNDGRYNYMETMSYLKVVGDISDLLSVNARSVNKNDIYYVMSLANVVLYDKNPENVLSHFFYLADDFNPHLYRSWVNINMDAEETDTVMYQMAEKARYLDGIISTSMGNNPHTGYGKYDLGNKFIEYMKSPFKYYLDNYVLNSETRNFLNGEDATYTLVTSFTDELEGKVKDATDREVCRRKDPLSKLLIEKDRYVDDYDIINKTEDDSILSNKQYYINDKTLIMTNKIDNDLYKKYFFEVIIHYLMQMIPSTTILVLKNFE